MAPGADCNKDAECVSGDCDRVICALLRDLCPPHAPLAPNARMKRFHFEHRGDAAARYYRALVWEEPDGLAYEMLQLSLCRRAAALRWRLHREGKAEAPGAWAACAHTTAEALLGL